MIFVQPIRLCTALRRKNKKYPKCLSLPHMSYVNFFEKPHDDGQNDNKNIIFDVNCKTAKIRGYQALFSWYDGGIIIKKTREAQKHIQFVEFTSHNQRVFIHFNL